MPPIAPLPVFASGQSAARPADHGARESRPAVAPGLRRHGHGGVTVGAMQIALIDRHRSNQLRPHRLLDTVIATLGIKNDAALARALQVSPTSVSRIRNGYRVVTADLVLRVHEYGQIPIADLKSLLDEGTRLR